MKSNLRAILLSTFLLSIISILIPKTSQAAIFPGDQRPLSLGFELEVDTSVSNTGSNSEKLYIDAIQDFRIFDGDVESRPTIEGTDALFSDLSVKEYTDLLKARDEFDPNIITENSANADIPEDYFDISVDAQFFEYSFEFPRDEFDNEPGTLTWLIPSIFSYTVGENSIDINTSDGESVAVDSLSGLEDIFNLAEEAGLDSIEFPTISSSFTTNEGIRFNLTTSVPESNTNNAIIILGILGTVYYVKRKFA